MLFKYPQLLYGLFLLIIPIIVHLFQLRRFKKEYFTNVEFLKKVKLQTRKSARIKKWLTLLARLLALACIIIAFAQPYFPSGNQTLKEKETVVYLDNSFSMQKKGRQGELLKKAIQDLITNIPEDYQFSLFTNSETYRNTTIQELKTELQQIDYTSDQLPIKTAALQANNLFNKNEAIKKWLVISDFQQKNTDGFSVNEDIEASFIQLQPENSFNISIDSVVIEEKKLESTEISVWLSASEITEELTPVSLFNKNELLSKSSVSFAEDKTAKTNFTIPTGQTIEGVLQINDNSLQFDNTLYFTLQENEKIKVFAINGEDGNFLKKIYNDREFEFNSVTEDQINYNALEGNNLIVLNELKNIPEGLIGILQKHQEQGGSIVVIPSNENLSTYQNLFLNLGLDQLNGEINEEVKLTKINFSHPLFQGVFNKTVENFEYPTINNYYPLSTTASNILSFNNNRTFLAANGSNYAFTAALNNENTNFKNSPLIVPVFYNMAVNSLKLPQLYYLSNQSNSVEINVQLPQDRVIKVEDSTSSFIPMQQRFPEKVQLTIQENAAEAGNFDLKTENNSLKGISFNYSRAENQLEYANISTLEGVYIKENIAQFFSDEVKANEINYLWKWFVIFAMLFLIIEFLLIKFLK